MRISDFFETSTPRLIVLHPTIKKFAKIFFNNHDVEKV